MYKYTKIFKVLSTEKRLKLLMLLLKEKQGFYVCEIADALEESHYNVSKYLQELKSINLVVEERFGRLVKYSINKDIDPFLENLFKTILSIPEEYISKNIFLLKLRLSLREKNKCVVGVNDPKWKKLLKDFKSDERVKTNNKGG